MYVHSVSCVWLFATPRTVAHQALLSRGFSRQEYWSGLPFPTPGDLLDPGIERTSLMSPALASRFFITSTTWEAQIHYTSFKKKKKKRPSVKLGKVSLNHIIAGSSDQIPLMKPMSSESPPLSHPQHPSPTLTPSCWELPACVRVSSSSMCRKGRPQPTTPPSGLW